MGRIGLLLALLLTAVALGMPARAGAAPVKHVWVLFLENKNFDESFGALPTRSTYLSDTLPAQGALVPNFYGITHFSLGNYLGLLSGQGSNLQTQADCQFFTPVLPALPIDDGQVLGTGCVYPARVQTLADQLLAKGMSWKGYMQGMESPCQHPALGAPDSTQSAKPGHQYASRHNPFVYFESIIGSPECAKRDVELGALPGDLRSVSTTPNFSFITPDLCEDAHDAPCVDGRPGGLASADGFLRTWVPRILNSLAYKRDGMLVITFDEAEAKGLLDDASACCDEPQFPNTPNNGGIVLGRGGGRIGAVVLSPFVDPGTIDLQAYNHFSLLRTLEDLYGLDHLGYAARPGLSTFGPSLFTCYDARPPRPVRGRFRRGGLIRRAVVFQGTAHRPSLEVKLRRGGRVRVALARRRGTPRPVGGPRSTLPCQRVRTGLPVAHGTAIVTASVRGGTETRRIPF